MNDRKDSDFQLYAVFAALFASVLVLVPSAASKFIAVGPLAISGATLIFPITFIFNDLLTEVYGFSRSRKIIWTGLGCQVLAAFTYWIVGVWPAAEFWNNQAAFDAILGAAPRITLASLSAYFCGEFANSAVLSKMKYWAHGARGIQQSWRFVASTIVGEALDSVVFMFVGFLGVIPTDDLLRTIATIWVAKVIYEIVALPATTYLANWVKRIEGIDHIDTPQATTYNPFAVFFRE